jgi:hypothetical protein
MTASDYAKYIVPLDYSDFSETYFASRRVLTSLTWEAPALFGSTHSFVLNGITQFDVNDANDTLNTQYIEASFLFSPHQNFDITLGAVLGFAEPKEQDMEMSLAGLIGANWQLPTAVQDVVTLGIRWGSGRVNDTIGPFRPVTTINQGNVFDAALPGLIVLQAGYTIRPYTSLSFGLDGRYFLRSDLNTFQDTSLKSGDERALGGELYGSITWVPVLDVAVLFSGGAFFPGMGNALSTDAPLRWKASIGLILSL